MYNYGSNIYSLKTLKGIKEILWVKSKFWYSLTNHKQMFMSVAYTICNWPFCPLWLFPSHDFPNAKSDKYH